MDISDQWPYSGCSSSRLKFRIKMNFYFGWNICIMVNKRHNLDAISFSIRIFVTSSLKCWSINLSCKCYRLFPFWLDQLLLSIRNRSSEIARRFVNILPSAFFLDFVSYLYRFALESSATKHPQIHSNSFFGKTGLLIDAEFFSLNFFSFLFRVSLKISFVFFLWIRCFGFC